METAINSRNALPPDVTIRNDLKAGDIGYLIYLHGILYAQEHGWDHTFEPYVAIPMGEFSKSHTDRERIWVVEHNGSVAGSIAIVEVSQEQAQLRWLLLHPDLRGYGIGRVLVEEALQFCKECAYSSIYLWTVNGLTAATGLYKSAGFSWTEEKTHPIWGAVVTEQRFELNLD